MRFRYVMFMGILFSLLLSMADLMPGWIVQPFKLDDATPVHLRLKETISSATAHVGDTVDFEVLDDVKVNGIVVIPKGALAWGTVTKAKHKGHFGHAGKLDINIDDVRLADGEKCPLRAIQGGSGRGHGAMVTGATVATALVFWPAAPLWFLKHGKDITIPEGTQITAFINGDMDLVQSKFASSSPTQAAAATTSSTTGASTSNVSPGSATCGITVQSTPNGCDIMVDGKFSGDTPSTLRLSPGTHTVTIQKSGYKTWQRTLSLEAGSNITIDATLSSGQ